MKKTKNLLLPIFMLLLVLLGAVLPTLISAVQDNKLRAQTDARALGDVKLTLKAGSDLKQALSLISSNYSQIGLREGVERTGEEAMANAEDALSKLTQAAILPQSEWSQLSEAAPFVLIGEQLSYAIDESSGQKELSEAYGLTNLAGTVVVWECSFTSEDGRLGCTLRIDDATGKMLSFLIWQNSSHFDYLDALTDDSMQQWAEFFRDYYGFDGVSIGKPYTVVSSGVMPLEFTYTDDSGLPAYLLLLLTFYENAYNFSW